MVKNEVLLVHRSTTRKTCNIFKCTDDECLSVLLVPNINLQFIKLTLRFPTERNN